jgi:uncharacterized oligopeptide transporter (OPT) family protein
VSRHPRFFEPAVLALVAPLCVFGAIVGIQVLVKLGISANTSLIGALAAMAVARLPVAAFVRYRSIHVQNLAQSAISAATFGAANSLFLPIGIPFLLGLPDLIPAMFAGAFLAMLLDAYLLYRMFGSAVFPAEGAWPPGRAAAEAIFAGDQGGRKASVLAGGVLLGALGSAVSVPMSAFGVAFIGNPVALAMFGAGLLVRSNGQTLFRGVDLGNTYIPHGIMIGAGIVSLLQIGLIVLRRNIELRGGPTRPLQSAVKLGLTAYLAVAFLIAIISGLWTQMGMVRLCFFVLYAGSAALVHELIVGLAAMHTGWFPAFAVALITLFGGLLAGFPPSALALLAGFTAATGPAFADMGYDLKAGFLLRGKGLDPQFESEGRRQQLFAAMFALVVAGAVVLASYRSFFVHDLLAPVDRVYAATIRAGLSRDVARSLLWWTVPGATAQLLGGAQRQVGILFATGLLINTRFAGWAVMIGLAGRTLWTKWRGVAGQSSMEVFAAGVIGGDALFSFLSALFTIRH